MSCQGCPLAERLRAAHDLIVELQHELRELRDELGNIQLAQAGYPIRPSGERAAG